VGGSARRDDASPAVLAHKRGVEGLYELPLLGHAPNPAVGFNGIVSSAFGMKL
jgi:hypothetical protein